MTTSPIAALTPPARVSHWGADFLASFVVFLVALPLCMGISIASGLPPTAGIITGIIGGLVVGFFAGSPLQASGPAAGLSVLVLQFVQAHGPAMLGVVVLFAGLIQVLAGAFRLGQWFRAVSPAVIHGMLAGIGVLILVAQIHVMFDGAPLGTGLQNLMGIPAAILEALAEKGAHLSAGGIGLVTIAAIFGWGSLAPKSWRVVPAPLVGVIAGMLAAVLFKTTGIKYVEVPGNIWSVTILPTPANLMRIVEPAIFIGAVSIALIASAETLLCATAVDQMHRGERTKYDKELMAQGAGNALCGVLGVLPMTGVIVRSAANVEAGAKTRYSTILHGVWLLLFASALPFTLRYVPVSALAGVLVFTGYKLAYPKVVPELMKYGRSEVFIYLATIITIVFGDLLKGVMLGLGLSLLKLLYTFSHLAVRREDNATEETIDLHLEGAATLIRLPMLASELDKLPVGAHVRVFIDELSYIDHACIELLTNWDVQHRGTGGHLEIEWEGLTNRYRNKPGMTAKEAVV